MDTRTRCGGFIPQNRGDFSSLWIMRFRGVVSLLLSFKWTLALAVGVLSLKIEAISHLYGLCVLGVLLACFYLLDAYYLMLERLFREQYQWLIKNRLKTDERLFEVFPAHQTCRFALYLCTMLSFSLFPYWALGLCLVGYGFVSNSVSMECWL